MNRLFLYLPLIAVIGVAAGVLHHGHQLVFAAAVATCLAGVVAWAGQRPGLFLRAAAALLVVAAVLIPTTGRSHAVSTETTLALAAAAAAAISLRRRARRWPWERPSDIR